MVLSMQDQGEVGLSETQWRLLWEQQLDWATRRRITKATRRGRALADPDEAAIAVEFARRRMSRVRLAAAINTILYLGLLVAMVVLREGDVVWTYWLLFGVFLAAAVASPVIALWLSRRLRAAERRNREVLSFAERRDSDRWRIVHQVPPPPSPYAAHAASFDQVEQPET